MKNEIKNHNFCNFNLKVAQQNLSKDSLSILDFANVDVYSKTIKTLGGFSNLLNKIIGKAVVDAYNENNNDFLDSLVYFTAYDYFDTLQNKIVTIYFVIDDNFNLYKLFFSDGVISVVSQNLSFSTLPEVFTESKKLYFYEKGVKLVYFENNFSPVLVLSFMDIKCKCDYYDSTFFVPESDPYKIYYTEKCDVGSIGDDLSIYSCIESDITNGRFLKLVNFKNNLYAISQYGIFKISSRDGSFYFSMSCFLKSKINEKTICEINDYIIFFAEQNCYIFDGNQYKQIFSDETKLINGFESKMAEVFDNKYYLLANMPQLEQVSEDESDEDESDEDESESENDEEDGEIDESDEDGDTSQKSVIMEFDITTMKVNCYKVGVMQKFYVIKSMSIYELVFCKFSDTKNEFLVKCDEESLSERKSIKFNSICFNDDDLKIISEIKIISTGNFYLKVQSDIAEKVFSVSGNFEVSSLGLMGYYFDIEIFSDSDFMIKSILFQVKSLTERL